MKALLLLALVLPPLAHAVERPALPNPNQRAAVVRAIAEEMLRVDGEGLRVRRERPNEFSTLVTNLEAEARTADSWPKFLRSLKRLDLAYPNLHSRLEPGPRVPKIDRIIPVIGFAGEWLASGHTAIRLNRVDQVVPGAEEQPRIGDLLVAINGLPINTWLTEHFDFCKWSRREQCDLEFASDFYNEFTNWTRETPLTYSLERDGRSWTIPVAIKQRAPNGSGADPLLCANFPNRYPEFRLAYSGKFACFFQKIDDPSTLLLRISSFQYLRSNNQEGPKTLQEEVDRFWPYWQTKAPETKHLLIDLANNGGGNQPTPYYEVLFPNPYQEQWVEFKKISELDDPALRDAMFWSTKAQEIWFENLKRDGTWNAIEFGNFLPRVPMFCALQDRDCREGKFPVRAHGFTGQVSLIVNHWCVSSCDGFVYAFKQELGDRVQIIGQPQAADTTYSRIRIGVMQNESLPNGFEVKMLPQYGKISENILLSQVATVTRSVTNTGEIVSGKPLAIDRFVENTVARSDFWIEDAVRAALSSVKLNPFYIGDAENSLRK